MKVKRLVQGPSRRCPLFPITNRCNIWRRRGWESFISWKLNGRSRAHPEAAPFSLQYKEIIGCWALEHCLVLNLWLNVALSILSCNSWLFQRVWPEPGPPMEHADPSPFPVSSLSGWRCWASRRRANLTPTCWSSSCALSASSPRGR
jgi:hypothetical protein